MSGATASLVRADGVCNIQNFAFASGQVISELRLHYSTLGTPQYDAAGHLCNAVLLLHSSTGNRLHWLSGLLGGGLFGPGQPLDVERFFIVVPDLIGHGESSKPSDGLRTSFPRYRCRDMVNALHLLVTQGLKIRALHLLMGTSLGAMLAWEWAHRYPDAAQRIVPIGAYPLPLGGRNWMVRRMIIEAIRNDPAWAHGHYDTPPSAYRYTAPLLLLMAHGVQHLQNLAPNQAAADKYYEQLVRTVAQHDANDLLYVIESTLDYDPSAHWQQMTAQILTINFEGDEICRPDLDVFEAAVAQIPRARSVLIAQAEQSCGHLTYYQLDTWKAHLAAFLAPVSVDTIPA